MNVFVVEDSAPVRERVVQLIDASDAHAVVGWAEGEDEAVRRIAELKPDAALFDIMLAQGSGIAALAQARRLVPHLIGIVMTLHPTQAHRQASFAAGAAGFLDKALDLPRIAEILSSMAGPAERRRP